MSPVAAESKNSKPSSKKKINKKINTSLDNVVSEENNIQSPNIQNSSDLNGNSIQNKALTLSSYVRAFLSNFSKSFYDTT